MSGRSPDDLGKVVIPCAVLAVVDVVALIVAIATGHYVLAVVAGLLFVPLATVAGIGAGIMRRDQPPDRWVSKQPWTESLTTTAEHDLVIAAIRAAERIATGTGSVPRGPNQVQLDLAGELDQIDAEAYRIATATRQAGGSDPVLGQARQALTDRVTALTAYADGELDALSAFLDAREGDSFG